MLCRPLIPRGPSTGDFGNEFSDEVRGVLDDVEDISALRTRFTPAPVGMGTAESHSLCNGALGISRLSSLLLPASGGSSSRSMAANWARPNPNLDLAGDLDRRRHVVMVAGSRRSLTATHSQIFMLLYRHRGDIVYNDRIHAELSEGRDHPSVELIRENMRQLRKVLAGSRYRIVNNRSLGYELIVADTSDASATAPTRRSGAMGD